MQSWPNVSIMMLIGQIMLVDDLPKNVVRFVLVVFAGCKTKFLSKLKR